MRSENLAPLAPLRGGRSALVEKELLRREVLAKKIRDLQMKLARMQAERDNLRAEGRGLKAKLAVAEKTRPACSWS